MSGTILAILTLLTTLLLAPLATLYRAGADIGLRRTSNGQTTQRIYWSNKATTITADIPSEAELTPRLWCKWKVER